MTLAHPDLAAVTGPQPGTREHASLVTASKVAAIVGASPYTSPWALWQEMKGNVEPEPTSAVQARGHRLEAAVIDWWLSGHPDADDVLAQPWFPLGDWAGARPDLVCTVDGALAVVEAKTAARDDGWGTPGTDEIPEHYLAQVTWQMGCSGAQVAYVPMLGPRLEFREYRVEFDDELFAWLTYEARAFWESLLRDTPPDLDTSTATLSCLKRMHPDIDAGERAVITKRDARAYAAASAACERAEKRRRAAEIPIRDAMGRAQYAVLRDGTDIIRRQPSGRGITLKLIGDVA